MKENWRCTESSERISLIGAIANCSSYQQPRRGLGEKHGIIFVKFIFIEGVKIALFDKQAINYFMKVKLRKYQINMNAC